MLIFGKCNFLFQCQKGMLNIQNIFSQITIYWYYHLYVLIYLDTPGASETSICFQISCIYVVHIIICFYADIIYIESFYARCNLSLVSRKFFFLVPMPTIIFITLIDYPFNGTLYYTYFCEILFHDKHN